MTRSFEVFFDLRLNKRLSKQSWGYWSETPSRPLWRHSNAVKNIGSKLHQLSCRQAPVIAGQNIWFIKILKFVKNRNIVIRQNPSMLSMNTKSNCFKCNNTVLVNFCAYLVCLDIPLSSLSDFLPEGCSSQVSKIFETYFLSYLQVKPVKTFVQPSSYLQENQLQPSWPFGATIVTANINFVWSNQKTGIDSNGYRDCKTRSFDTLYFWNKNYILFRLLGHTNGNIEMCSLSAAATITMVAATIGRFLPATWWTHWDEGEWRIYASVN